MCGDSQLHSIAPQRHIERCHILDGEAIKPKALSRHKEAPDKHMEARRMVLELHLGNHFYLFDHAAKQRFNSKILSFLLNMILFFF